MWLLAEDIEYGHQKQKLSQIWQILKIKFVVYLHFGVKKQILHFTRLKWELSLSEGENAKAKPKDFFIVIMADVDKFVCCWWLQMYSSTGLKKYRKKVIIPIFN